MSTTETVSDAQDEVKKRPEPAETLYLEVLGVITGFPVSETQVNSVLSRASDYQDLARFERIPWAEVVFRRLWSQDVEISKVAFTRLKNDFAEKAETAHANTPLGWAEGYLEDAGVSPLVRSFRKYVATVYQKAQAASIQADAAANDVAQLLS